VLDFGVAKLMEGAASDRSMLALTAVGMVFGTPEFMSPEQACGQPLDGRSDLYALAATMFAMLTGCGLFQAGSPIEWLTCHARTPPPHLVEGKPDLVAYPQIDEMIQRCIAKRAEQRLRDADAMIDMIEAVELALGATPSLIKRPPSQPTVPQTPQPQRKPLGSTPSSYIPALTSDLREPTSVAASTRAESYVPSGTDSVPAIPTRRGLYIVIGALAIVAMIVAAIVIANNKGKKDGSVATKLADAGLPADAPIASAVVDAAPIDAVHIATIDGGRPLTGSGSHPTPRTNPEVEAHIAASYTAQRQGKLVTQIQEAQAALDLDARNVRAKLLIADALIRSGDLQRGCKYLRELGRNSVAIARARSANCSAN
jgi:serine/threonine-protein kinase